MIAYITGKLTFISPTVVHIETNGVGHNINISLNTFRQVEKLQTVKLWTHLSIKDDAHSLFGFFDDEEKQIFKHLISVSGVGTNTARIILSSLNPIEVKRAILNDQSAEFSKVKGIGPKTAKRIILDLKDKIAKEGLDLGSTIAASDLSNTQNEAIAALISLGFQKNRAEKTVKQYFSPDLSVQELIKLVLKQISK